MHATSRSVILLAFLPEGPVKWLCCFASLMSSVYEGLLLQAHLLQHLQCAAFQQLPLGCQKKKAPCLHRDTGEMDSFSLQQRYRQWL